MFATILAAVAVAYPVLVPIWAVSVVILAWAAATAPAETGEAAYAAASCAWASANCVFKAAICSFKAFSWAVFFAKSAYYFASSPSSLVFYASVDFCYCYFRAFA